MKKPTVAQMVAINSNDYPYLMIRSEGNNYHIKNDEAVQKFGKNEVKQISFETPCIDTKIQIILKLEV